MTVIDAPTGPSPLAGPYEARDRAVLGLAAHGLTQPAMAHRLGISESAARESAKRIRSGYGAPSIASAVARAIARGDLAGEARTAPSLNPRQLHLLDLITQGHTNQRIAGGAGVGKYTVGKAVWRLARRLGANNRPHIVFEAYRCGLLVPDPDGSGLILAGGAP